MNITQLITASRKLVKRAVLASAALVLIAAPSASAATISKTNNTDNLNLTTSWTGTILPGATDIAQWDSTVTAANTTVLGADLSWAGIKVVSPGGLVTINAGNTLTIGTSGIDLSTATQDLTLNCGLTLLGKQSWKAATGRTLTVAGTFTRTGTMVDFTSFNATATLSGIANAGTTGILGPWATTGSGTSMNYVQSTAGAISAYTGQTPSGLADLSDVNNAGVNYSFNPGTGTATLSAPIIANTLLYKGTGSGSAIVNNSPNRITVNGLLGQGTGRYIISGTGNLMIGANKELVCNYNVGFSSISCPIVDYNDGSTTYPSSVTINVNPSSGNEFTWGNAGSTYSGGTTINSVSGSAFQFDITSGASAAFGTGPITLNGNNITLRPTGTTFANNITINKNSSVTVRNNSGTTVFNGNITLNSSITFANAGANQSETLNGNVTGTGGINVSHPAALTDIVLLTGTNTYTGPTAVNTGLLKAGRASVANVSGAFGLNSAVSIANNANARIDLNGFNTQIGSLTGGGALGGNVINSTTAATLTVGGDNTSPAAYAGIISATTPANLALAKIGSGTLTLSGINTYAGDTVVQGGTLSLSQAYLADGADVKLYTGTTLNLTHSSTDNIRSLYIDGVPQAVGDYGVGASNPGGLITGTGKLNVGTLGSTLTYTISGTVTFNGAGLAGVTVSDGTRSATTASDGTYTISAVPDAATYTVTASLDGYTFTPSSVSVKGMNVTGNNYTAALPAASITLTGPLGAVDTTYGTASASPTNFTVAGSNLTGAPGNLTVTPPSGYEVSLSSGAGYTNSLSVPYTGSTLASTTVYVRLAATAGVNGGAGYTGNISVSGGGVVSPATIATASSTVTPGTLTITANNQNKPFGTTQTTPVTGSTAFTAVGLKNGDTIGTVTLTYGSGGLLDTDPVGSTSTITPSTATGGTFTPGNYSITYTPDSGTLTVTTSPVITTSGSLTAVNTTYGTATITPTSFTLSGVDMAVGITVTPPAGFQVSTTSDFSSNVGNNGSPITVGAAGTITETTIFVRLAATATVGSSPYSGNVACTSTGATQKDVATAPSSVSPATLTITASNQGKSYGTTQTTPVSGSSAFTADGLKNGDTVGTVTLDYGSGGLAPTDPVGSTSTITPSAATGGSFTAVNYNIGYSDGTLTVTPGALDHFAISTISSATAGTPITGITLTAQDVNNNTLNAGPSTFSGTVIYSGTAGITGTSANFTNGVLSGVSVTPTVAGSGMTFVVTDSVSGKTGTGIFDVNPGALDHFAISAIPSPQTAGTAISDITLTALDVYTNTLSTGPNAYSGTVDYSGTAGITGTSANFTDGVLSGVSVTPTVAGSGRTFIVTGSGKTGTRSFDIASAAVSAASSTVVASPTNVMANGTSASTITVTLRDVYNNGVSNKTVTLVSSRGTNDTIAAASGTSSAAGVVTFAVRSTTLGESVFSATDVTDSNLVIPQTATVNWLVNLTSATGVFLADTAAGGNGTASTYNGGGAANTYSGSWAYLTDGITSPSSKWLGVGTSGWGLYPGTVGPGKGTGFYFTLTDAVVMNGIQFFTEDSAPGRSPMTMTIEGSFATGTDLLVGANWTLLYSGTAGLDTTPNNSTGIKVSVVNKTAYTSYRVLFPTTVAAAPGGVQLADIHVFGVPYKPPQGTVVLFF